MATGSKILSLGHYQPARVLTNDELATMVDTSDEWIRSRVGIATRRLAASGETVADMAGAAAAKTLARAGIDAAQVDLVVVATCTAVDRMPNIAARVARHLAIPAAGTFDVNVACSGFCYALATADHAIRGGASRTALVVGADKMSDFLDWEDRSTCVIFGDGAGAAVLTAAETEETVGVGPVVWGSDPERGPAIALETTGPDGPPALFRQDGGVVYRWATRSLTPIARQACERAGVDPADLAAVVTHQANLRIIDMIAHRLGASRAIVARDVVESGNTSAASVPLALSKLVERGEVTSGAPVLLLGFGAGLAYAAQVVRCP
ncbi:beta-ketoacyl-ACP synthase III [Streptomyces sp. NBC_01803]|uniref:beta-ketoacyl-ACP synthase III n=1 Tax=Streptomyces sp. NBC_01803 TaxID=2975946 RepID=UPI002DD7A7C3|nr:beta-ketoacyl-ACP synthase III [Streptomyces sp. NBC_01803]WSA47481.1 ketoacyl-ACP synthase III [Streptomyces sp. NBC_01803]